LHYIPENYVLRTLAVVTTRIIFAIGRQNTEALISGRNTTARVLPTGIPLADCTVMDNKAVFVVETVATFELTPR
jgi:hypothetical protein